MMTEPAKSFGSEGKSTVPDFKPLHNIEKPLPEESTLTPEAIEAGETSKLPRPTGYRILILPYTPSNKTKGGILLATETVDREKIATVVGYVVDLGPDAYNDANKFPDGPWCGKGEWVIFGRYAGARFKIDGGDMRLLNDDEILAVIDNPEDILSA